MRNLILGVSLLGLVATCNCSPKYAGIYIDFQGGNGFYKPKLYVNDKHIEDIYYFNLKPGLYTFTFVSNMGKELKFPTTVKTGEKYLFVNMQNGRIIWVDEVYYVDYICEEYLSSQDVSTQQNPDIKSIGKNIKIIGENKLDQNLIITESDVINIMPIRRRVNSYISKLEEGLLEIGEGVRIEIKGKKNKPILIEGKDRHSSLRIAKNASDDCLFEYCEFNNVYIGIGNSNITFINCKINGRHFGLRNGIGTGSIIKVGNSGYVMDYGDAP